MPLCQCSSSQNCPSSTIHVCSIPFTCLSVTASTSHLASVSNNQMLFIGCVHSRTVAPALVHSRTVALALVHIFAAAMYWCPCLFSSPPCSVQPLLTPTAKTNHWRAAPAHHPSTESLATTALLLFHSHRPSSSLPLRCPFTWGHLGCDMPNCVHGWLRCCRQLQLCLTETMAGRHMCACKQRTHASALTRLPYKSATNEKAAQGCSTRLLPAAVQLGSSCCLTPAPQPCPPLHPLHPPPPPLLRLPQRHRGPTPPRTQHTAPRAGAGSSRARGPWDQTPAAWRARNCY